MTGQPVEQVGQLCRAAGADEHVVHSGQHRPVTGERDRQFDLTQVIDAHHAVVPLLGQEHLDEVRRHRQLLQRPAGAQRGAGYRPERRLRGPAGGPEVGRQDPVGDPRYRERGEGASHMSTGVTELEPPRTDDLQGGAGDHTELSGPGDRAGQRPSGDGDPHAALDDVGHSCVRSVHRGPPVAAAAGGRRCAAPGSREVAVLQHVSAQRSARNPFVASLARTYGTVGFL